MSTIKSTLCNDSFESQNSNNDDFLTNLLTQFKADKSTKKEMCEEANEVVDCSKTEPNLDDECDSQFPPLRKTGSQLRRTDTSTIDPKFPAKKFTSRMIPIIPPNSMFVGKDVNDMDCDPESDTDSVIDSSEIDVHGYNDYSCDCLNKKISNDGSYIGTKKQRRTGHSESDAFKASLAKKKELKERKYGIKKHENIWRSQDCESKLCNVVIKPTKPTAVSDRYNAANGHIDDDGDDGYYQYNDWYDDDWYW